MTYKQKTNLDLPAGNILKYGIYAFFLFMLFMVLTNTTFITINPGEKGVIFKRFAGGLKKDKVYNQGFHIVAPWNDMIIYDTRINEGFEKMDVLSKNGLSIAVELSYRYFAIPEQIGYLHDEMVKTM